MFFSLGKNRKYIGRGVPPPSVLLKDQYISVFFFWRLPVTLSLRESGPNSYFKDQSLSTLNIFDLRANRANSVPGGQKSKNYEIFISYCSFMIYCLIWPTRAKRINRRSHNSIFFHFCQYYGFQCNARCTQIFDFLC